MIEPRLSYHAFPSLSAPERQHRLAVYEWGDPSASRVVVCVHGLTRNARDFDYLAAALAQDFRVIAPDIVGRGSSDFLENSMDYNYNQYVADMTALLNLLGIASCDWVGTSMGGIIGMMLASFTPGRIGKLALNDVGARIPAVGLERISRYAGRFMDFPNRAAAEAHLRQVFAPFGIPSEEGWRHLFLHSIRETAQGVTLAYDARIMDLFRVQTRDFNEFQDVDLSEVWQRVSAPTLILRGELSDILLRETADTMRASRSGVTLLEIPGVGHAPSLMTEDQIRAVSDWLSH